MPEKEYRAGSPLDRDDMTGEGPDGEPLHHGVGSFADRRDGAVPPTGEEEFRKDFFDSQKTE